MIQISGLVPDSDERGELRPSLFFVKYLRLHCLGDARKNGFPIVHRIEKRQNRLETGGIRQIRMADVWAGV